MKGLTKTIVALALVITVLATMGMSAMAATYTTKTTYQADNEISVTATAADLEPGDIVTYVATTDSTTINEETIVYLNQDVVADGDDSVTFNYTTDITDIDATMYFGGSEEEQRQTATADGLTLTVTLGDATETVNGVAESAANEPVIRKIKLPTNINLSGKELTEVTFAAEGSVAVSITEFYVTDGTLVIYTDAITNANGTLALTAKDKTGTDSLNPSIAKESGICDNDTDGNADDYNALAKAPSGEKFGVVVYTAEGEAKLNTINGELTTITEDEVDFLVLPALGRNGEGIFAVVIEDYADILTAGDYKVKAYAIVGSDLKLSAGAATLVVE